MSDADDVSEATRDALGYLNPSYVYTRLKNVTTPSLKELTDAEDPDAVWIATFAVNILATQASELEHSTVAIAQMVANIHAKAADITDHVDGEPVLKSADDFFEVLIDNAEDVVTTGHVEEQCKFVITDAAFASYRVSGPNPVVLRLATAADLKLIGQAYAHDPTLLQLANSKRLFIIDYSALATLTPGKSPSEGFEKLTLGSIGLFKLEGRDLAPVLIKIISHGDKPRVKVVTPPAHPGKIDFSWAIAKMIFQSNDGDFHEANSHLGGTHLVAETFMVATQRRLPPNHPIHKLMIQHFLGTAYINNSADEDLISDGGIVDNLVSGNIAEIRGLISQHNAAVLAEDLRFPEHLKARKVDVDNVPNLDYPFRDDGTLLWNAINKWASDYVTIFYPDDAAVAADKSLNNWIKELGTEGNVKWIASMPSVGVEELRDIIASVIFIASVEHAAVNFPQRTHMQFTPAWPLAIYGNEDIIFKDHPTAEEMLSLFPPHSMLKKQAEVAYSLGSIFHTQLGQYEEQASWFDFSGYFGDIEGGDGLVIPDDYIDAVDEALTSFQHDLKLATKIINNRNKRRRFPYVTLLPESIPQSINI